MFFHVHVWREPCLLRWDFNLEEALSIPRLPHVHVFIFFPLMQFFLLLWDMNCFTCWLWPREIFISSLHCISILFPLITKQSFLFLYFSIHSSFCLLSAVCELFQVLSDLEKPVLISLPSCFTLSLLLWASHELLPALTATTHLDTTSRHRFQSTEKEMRREGKCKIKGNLKEEKKNMSTSREGRK